MTELKKWENEEIVALLRSELQSVEDLTDTGKLDDVVDEIERRLDLKMDVRQYLAAYRDEQLKLIIDNQMQLVTAEEFSKLHKEKLASEHSAERFEKRCQKYEELLNDLGYLCKDNSFMWNRTINKNIAKTREEVSKI